MPGPWLRWLHSLSSWPCRIWPSLKCTDALNCSKNALGFGSNFNAGKVFELFWPSNWHQWIPVLHIQEHFGDAKKFWQIKLMWSCLSFKLRMGKKSAFVFWGVIIKIKIPPTGFFRKLFQLIEIYRVMFLSYKKLRKNLDQVLASLPWKIQKWWLWNDFGTSGWAPDSFSNGTSSDPRFGIFIFVVDILFHTINFAVIGSFSKPKPWSACQIKILICTAW